MHTPERVFGWVLALWLGVGVAVSVRTALRPDSHTVFPVFALGSLHWWADLPVYGNYRPVDHFRYPPLCAVLLTPLALLGTTLGGILWAWLSLSTYGYGCWRFLRDVIPRRWSFPQEALFLGLALFAALRGLWNAQSNAVVIGLLLVGCAELVRERWWRAAGWLTLPVFIKLTPLAVVLLLVALAPRQLGWRVAVLALVGLLLPFATRPPEQVAAQYVGWVEQMRATASERWPGFRDAWTLWQVVVPTAAAPGLGYRAAQLGTALLALLWVVTLAQRPVRERVTLTLGIGTGWLLLFGPSVEHATFVLLAPVLLWAVLDDGSYLLGAAAVLILVLGWGALTGPLLPWCPWLVACLPLGTLLYLVGLLGRGQRTRAGGAVV